MYVAVEPPDQAPRGWTEPRRPQHARGAKDSVPPPTPSGTTSGVISHGELPEPSMKVDSIDSAAQAHLQRHRMLRLPYATD
jgi:hypothetical protein